MAPSGEPPCQQQAVGKFAPWWLWCLRFEYGEGAHQELLHYGTLAWEWVFVVHPWHTHSVCTSVNGMTMYSVPILWEATLTSLCAACMTQSEYILCGITYWLTSMIASLISTVTWNSLLNYSSTFWALVHMQGCMEHCTWKSHSFH